MKKTLLTFLFVMIGFITFSIGTNASNIQTAPVRNESGYLGRQFQSDFDKMFDNFERSTLSDVGDIGCGGHLMLPMWKVELN